MTDETKRHDTTFYPFTQFDPKYANGTGDLWVEGGGRSQGRDKNLTHRFNDFKIAPVRYWT